MCKQEMPTKQMRPSKCSNCKTKAPVVVNTGVYRFCSYDCAVSFAQDKANEAHSRKMAKAKQVQVKKVKAQKSKDRARLKELKPPSQWFKTLSRLVNQWIVHVRDNGKPCYTCGTSNPAIKYDAGHRHHAGRGGGDRRRFLPENIKKQCSVNCNQHGSGMPKEFDIALDQEYGTGFADHLACESNYPTLKEQFPTWQDIEEEILRYRKLLRDAGLTPNG